MAPEQAPPSNQPPEPRRELRDAPPFATWRALYVVVVGALAVEILLGALVTRLSR